jgi:DNA-binding LacI/PurR family transcriptional regulator
VPRYLDSVAPPSVKTAPAQALRPTIFQVAEAAGVSITTVSHVFSGNRKVHEQTRARVLEAAERLGYQPRPVAQALATGRTMTLALEITFKEQELVLNPYFTSLLPAMSATAIELGYSFLFVPPNASRETFIEPLITERRIDAAILLDPVADDPFLVGLVSHGLPFASVGRLVGSDGENWVDNDHGAVVEHALAHLRARGYERPALFTISAPVSYVRDYVEGFKKLVPAGESAIFIAPELSERAAEETIGDVLGRPDRPDAVLCIHDTLAVGTLRAAEALGLPVPDALGVMGVGDSVLAQHARPALTSVRVFPEKAGKLVVELADELARAGEVTAPRIVPAKLVPRTSTAKG